MSPHADKIQELYDRNWYADEHPPGELLNDYNEEKKYAWFWAHTKLDARSASFFEIGSGAGACYAFLKERGVTNYTSCDTNDQIVIAFKKRFPERAEHIFHEDAITALQMFPNHHFDCITTSMVLEHLKEDYFVDLMSLMVAKLKKDGELWIHVPCAESLLSLYSLYYDLSHRRLFTLNNFSTLAGMYHLRIIAHTGKVISVRDWKSAIIYLHDKLVYWLNRFFFAFIIGTRAHLGAFSTEISVIIKK